MSDEELDDMVSNRLREPDGKQEPTGIEFSTVTGAMC